MSVIEQFIAKARTAKRRLVLPEGQDPRVVIAANRVVTDGIASVVVLGSEAEISTACAEAGITERRFESLDYLASPEFETYAETFKLLRAKKGISIEEAREQMKSRIFFGAMMTHCGTADGLVAGSIASTGDMLRAAFMVIGTAPGIKSASSAFIMDLKNPAPNGENTLLFADCAVNPNPDANQLVDIALATANTYRALFSKQPKVAFLSFSTYGSAKHEILVKVKAAAEMFAARVQAENLDILCDPNELQADASIVPSVASSKTKGSPLAGGANVLIFPDLNAGNICYKLVQRLADADAFGPVIQGLAKPLNDLSRGCSADDIWGTCAVTVCQTI